MAQSSTRSRTPADYRNRTHSDDARRLGPAFAKIAMAVEELGAIVRVSSNATEAVLRSGLPWLAGVLSRES